MLWAVTYMGQFMATDIYASAEKARDALDARNERYPGGAAQRWIVPLYATPVTQKEAP